MVSVEIVLCVKLLLSQSVSAQLLIAMVMVAALVILSVRIFDITAFSLAKGELKAEMASVKEHLEETDRKIVKLFLLTMSGSMYDNLRKLVSGKFGHYELGIGLERELYHLRSIGYVDVESIQAIPKKGNDLSPYVKITETGKAFVAYRESMKAET